MQINISDRLNYYYGSSQYELDPPEIHNEIKHDRPILSTQNYTKLKAHYITDINKYIKLSPNPNIPLWFQVGDCSYTGKPFPVFVKTRDSWNPKANGVIANLNSVRHWSLVSLMPLFDVPWEKKESKIIWRGTTTGCVRRNPEQFTREDLVKNYWNKYDVAFHTTSTGFGHLKKYVKSRMTQKDMLKCKYLLVINGNDKASALNWILASNSLPIMPKPRFLSWLCEPWLKDGVHYIEVKDDFSDLDEKLEWCKQNDQQCKQIAYNGKDFILKNFMNKKTEDEITVELIQKVQKHLINMKIR